MKPITYKTKTHQIQVLSLLKGLPDQLHTVYPTITMYSIKYLNSFLAHWSLSVVLEQYAILLKDTLYLDIFDRQLRQVLDFHSRVSTAWLGTHPQPTDWTMKDQQHKDEVAPLVPFPIGTIQSLAGSQCQDLYLSVKLLT